MFKQLIIPLIATQAIASYCLKYVDDSLSVKQETRTANAQIAHDKAKENNWVHEDQNFPKNLWFVMFWSIDNGDYAGLGHIALAYIDDAGNMQIHDSEVHRGARQPYNSLEELENWFGSVGTKMTFLGWSEGVDNVKIIDKIKAETKTTIDKIDKKKEQLKIFGYPFFGNKVVGLNKNIFYKIDFK